jgi:hypothetical protein
VAACKELQISTLSFAAVEMTNREFVDTGLERFGDGGYLRVFERRWGEWPRRPGARLAYDAGGVTVKSVVAIRVTPLTLTSTRPLVAPVGALT